MRLFLSFLSCFLLLLAKPAAAQQPEILGSDAAACAAGAPGPAYKVTVTGFKDREGQLRIEIYNAVDSEFLVSSTKLIEQGKLFRRIDVPMRPEGDMTLCIAAPRPGTYAVVILHDRNRNGKFDLARDGVGFTRNPRSRFSKPKAAAVADSIGDEVKSHKVILNYFQGWFSGMGPLAR
jgi:uncharacterized protein (DUF2141 family)